MQRLVLQRNALLAIPKRFCIPVSSIPCPSAIPQVRYASKKAKKRQTAEETPLINTKGNKKSKTVEDDSLQGENFDLASLEENMQRSIERLRVALLPVVSRVGKISPSILDGVRVEIEGRMEKLQDYASISVVDMSRMKVNLYDPTYMRQVETALMNHTVSLSPSRMDDATIRISIAKPDLSLRTDLAKQAATLCENARTSIRAARHQGQKEIKKDENSNIVSGDEATREMKKLEEATKKHTATVDTVLTEAKKVILDD